MNNKGFLGFILILAMLTVILIFTIQINQNNENLKKTINELIKAENSNCERTLIENNIDKIIDTKLNEQITLQNFNTTTARNSINSALYNYLNSKAKIYFFNEQSNKITFLFLNQNSTVQLLKSEYFIYAQYVFAPNTVTTQIKQKLGNKLTCEFIFPKDYSKTIWRVV